MEPDNQKLQEIWSPETFLSSSLPAPTPLGLRGHEFLNVTLSHHGNQPIGLTGLLLLLKDAPGSLCLVKNICSFPRMPTTLSGPALHVCTFQCLICTARSSFNASDIQFTLPANPRAQTHARTDDTVAPSRPPEACCTQHLLVFFNRLGFSKAHGIHSINLMILKES